MPLSIIRVIFGLIFEGDPPFNHHILEMSLTLNLRNSVAVIIKVAYGYQVGENDDPIVRIMEDSLRIGAPLFSPRKYWVEFMPFRAIHYHLSSFTLAYSRFVPVRFIPSWFPGAGFKRFAMSIGKQLARFENVPFDWAKKQIVRAAD